MKAGYTVKNLFYSFDKFIEVINYEAKNEVVNFGWLFIDNIPKDTNTVGIWKIKKLK